MTLLATEPEKYIIADTTNRVKTNLLEIFCRPMLSLSKVERTPQKMATKNPIIAIGCAESAIA